MPTFIASGSDEIQVYGFYGIHHSAAAVEAAFDLVVQWMDRLEMAPGEMYFSRIGAKWWQNDFARGHKKLKKEGFENIKLFRVASEARESSPHGIDAFTVDYQYREREELAFVEIIVKSHNRATQSAEVLQVMHEVVVALHPEAGTSLCCPLPDHPGGRYSGEKDLSSWAEYQLWREGAHGRIGQANFLCPAQLAKPIAGMPLEEWITAVAGRGKLEPFAGGLTLWVLQDEELASATDAIDKAKALVERESWMPLLSKLWYEQTDRLNAKYAQEAKAITPKQLATRNKLIEHISALREVDGSMPVVPLEDYFTGNYDEASLAPNAFDNGRPALKKCHALLKKVNSRSDVQDVLVLIHETPEPDEDDDNEIWPTSDTIFIIASCPLADIVKATKALGSDEINDMGTAWYSNTDEVPAGVPELEEGMRVFALWWD